MIILVLEEVRATQQAAFEEIKSGRRSGRRCNPGAFDGGALPDLFDQAGEAILITGTEDFRILELNRRPLRLLGTNREEAGAAEFDVVLPGEESGEHRRPGGGSTVCQQRPLTWCGRMAGRCRWSDGEPGGFGGRPRTSFSCWR